MGRVNTFQDTGSGGSISIDRSTFTNSVGSAVSISEVLSDIISISKSSFSRNNNAGLGGALFIQNVQGSVSVTGSDFSENTAVLGGALYIAGGIENVSSLEVTFQKIELKVLAALFSLQVLKGLSLSLKVTFQRIHLKEVVALSPLQMPGLSLSLKVTF